MTDQTDNIKINFISIYRAFNSKEVKLVSVYEICGMAPVEFASYITRNTDQYLKYHSQQRLKNLDVAIPCILCMVLIAL